MKGKLTGKDKLIVDEFEDLGELESDIEHFDLLESDKKLFGDLETRKTTSIYHPETSWEVNKGMNSSRLHKLYSLFFDKSSAFYLGDNVSVLEDKPLTGAYGFQSKKNDQQIFLFSPDSDYVAGYNVDAKSDSGWLNDKLDRRLSEISEFCSKATQPVTFILPFVEMPTDITKGVQHQVLLTISYDPKSKQLTPTVYDSIGRDTYSESLSSYFKGKYRTTCDEILTQSIEKAVKSTDFTLGKFTRVAYNHQNRLTEGNCGSYTFRTIKEVISSSAQGTEVKIPGSGYITSNSYLTSQHVQDIENCIRYRNLGVVDIKSALTEGKTLPVQLSEFIVALEDYVKLRGQQSEKSMLNFVGYSKTAKLTAAQLLIDILNDIKGKNEISESQYDKLVKEVDCLMDSSLGKLVQFHLKNLGAESLQKLVLPCVKFDDTIDDFVAIEKDELFDVPDITGEELASKKEVEEGTLDKEALLKQKQIKTDLLDLREEDKAELKKPLHGGLKVK
ncbi:TPA: hypothetical protein JBD88_14575 [Legionella pneumophila subsp. pneumophila]|uniref:hypothetical protein n=1 Tax=Legionella pneumophila TaxID=446 RepID=UPI0005C42EE6|nr:hypothetical protein [Legionella pneumophila]HAT9694408.1 hypothetical protein [Legionella pneumophila subsp. pneumophila]CZH28433.1 Uncharacterised protein [Legionella pneumophila]GAN30128.1 hypothetical protein lpymt_01725 [Legionella pneumophila]HAT9829516.1 hypothetical protein [Legionella pneumophila subsp. pneumophila]HAT9911646.1 hypothetical protein [Legionella pneumophila subsp. pneumophila]